MVQATSRIVCEHIDQIQLRLGVSDEELASALGVASGVVALWKHHHEMPERAVRQRLEALAALDRHLHDLFKPGAVTRWLRTRPRNLGGKTPVEVIANGEFNRIEGLLTIVDHGMFA
ncbi:MAG: hypothetical protein ACRDJH_08785 [Thermomicrobiales bacterium]